MTRNDTIRQTKDPIVDILLSSISRSGKSNIFLGGPNITKLSRLLTSSAGNQVEQSLHKLAINSKYTTDDPPISGTFNQAQRKNIRSSDSIHSSQKSARGNSGIKTKTSVINNEAENRFSDLKDLGPTMIIHVCDEARDVKKDFNCPRQVLVREMKYFAEYLSGTDMQRADDVDISVHCDVTIFEWLMTYVKRHLEGNSSNVPKLEASNVISVLISSDFLKMDSLVSECITFCHNNMDSILAAPSNMNCINDSLVARIADGLSHNKIDSLKDRRDKFKSKLFMRKITTLFDASFHNTDSPENASTLFSCSACGKLLTRSLESKIPCSNSRMTISNRGTITHTHIKDPNWDVNDYILELKSKSPKNDWRHVYWKLWGKINCLTCSRCSSVFQCSQLNTCRYHPQAPVFLQESVSWECCKQKSFRLDAHSLANGCQFRDHVVDTVDVSTTGSGTITLPLRSNQVYNDLLAHRNMICTYDNNQKLMENNGVYNIFAEDEAATAANENSQSKGDASRQSTPCTAPRLQALQKVDSYDNNNISEDMARINYADEFLDEDEEEDVIEEDEDGILAKLRKGRPKKVTVNPEAILVDPPDFATLKSRKWDSTRSIRWNQDAQREDGIKFS
ncbi:DgyrCDS9266 [Dimorphilus gyrociliatus]|uniref:DgyrCDS9266 n=1 Tax=Dimorphilus gyrociliatus TaxID=2664684 RepID=A0A7I8VY82_9ANNE|nr:DgyrCDS9266 [Dimorphilus gyrociliatus]